MQKQEIRREHTCKGSIMLDPIVQAEIHQIESVLAVALLQHLGAEIGYEKAKGRCKIVCSPDGLIEHFE
jgi:hypothetical protein